MMFSVIMALAVFQCTMAAEIAGDVSKDDDLFTQCLYALIRVALLSATFVLGQRTFGMNNGHKKLRDLPSISKGTPRVQPPHGRHPKASKKLKVHVASDDEDCISTSAGSSDSEPDTLSSDDETAYSKSTKISIGDLLRCRPVAGPAPVGSLHAMSVNEQAPVSRKQFEERRWESLRNEGASGKSTVCKPVKAAPMKPSSKKPDSKPPKAPKAAVTLATVDAATAAANSARMAALLDIICTEDAPTDPKPTAAKSGPLPPWRRQAVSETLA
jgi:hypothetical protein